MYSASTVMYLQLCVTAVYCVFKPGYGLRLAAHIQLFPSDGDPYGAYGGKSSFTIDRYSFQTGYWPFP